MLAGEDVRFEPAPGAVLQAAPASVTGYFTSDIRRDPNWSFIQVTDAQGQRVELRISGYDGRILTVRADNDD